MELHQVLIDRKEEATGDPSQVSFDRNKMLAQ